MPDVGVVAALPKEGAAWHDGHHQADSFRVVVSGMGALRAAQTAKSLLADGAKALLSWGVAGGLRVDLRPGNLVLANRLACDGGEYMPDSAWREQLQHVLEQAGLVVISGGLWSHDRAVTSVFEKQHLAARDCVAVDMESMAVARVAHEAGVPFAAIKSICDPADRALPSDAAQWLRADGRVRPMAVARALARGPRMWRVMRVMQQDFHAACASLHKAALTLRLSCPA